MKTLILGFSSQSDPTFVETLSAAEYTDLTSAPKIL